MCTECRRRIFARCFPKNKYMFIFFLTKKRRHRFKNQAKRLAKYNDKHRVKRLDSWVWAAAQPFGWGCGGGGIGIRPPRLFWLDLFSRKKVNNSKKSFYIILTIIMKNKT